MEYLYIWAGLMGATERWAKKY